MQAADDIAAFRDICFSYTTSRLASIGREHVKFAHYTTATTGIKILAGQQIWLRNAGVMNDMSEINYGIECLKHATGKIELKERITEIANETHPSILADLLGIFDVIDRQNNTDMFMFSICEHDDSTDLGRLSMWRAYGGDAAGVCIVINSEVLLFFESRSDIALRPVLYGTPDDFAKQLDIVVTELKSNRDLIRRVPPHVVQESLTKALRSAVLSTKHPGFKEEREWRLIYLQPDKLPRGMSSSIECIRNIPQLVWKMRSENETVSRQVFDRLLHKVIIGPTSYPFTVKGAFVQALTDRGVYDAADRVKLSDIPLRQKN